MIILEDKKVLEYLEKRRLIKQYQKAKQNLIEDRYSQVDFKERKPSGSGVWSFRINKKYRALCYFYKDELTVSMIDDHQ